MRRREFLATLLGSAPASAYWLHAAHGQTSRERPLIAYLAGSTRSVGSPLADVFQEGLRELGYAQDRNIKLVHRFAEGREERLPILAEELVSLQPAVIMAAALNAAVAVRRVTGTIPIVSAALADAVELGLVGSYARPGGNVTGITPYVAGLPLKQMELVHEVVPGARIVGLLGNMNDPKAPPQRYELEDAGRSLNIKFIVPDIRTPEDIEGAMEAFASARVDAVILLQTTMLFSQRVVIAGLAAANRLPTICGYREHVDDGALISYGVNLRWCFHRAASYVHKILNGAAPGDLPVEFPTQLQMVVNLRTAKAIGITLSPLLLARADEVIE